MAGFSALKDSLLALGLSVEAQVQFFNVVAGERPVRLLICCMPRPAEPLWYYFAQASCTWVRSASTQSQTCPGTAA